MYALLEPPVLLAWRNWQTRTAQDRMGKPVEVRVLSRAVMGVPQSTLPRTENYRQAADSGCINGLLASRSFPSRRPTSLHQL